MWFASAYGGCSVCVLCVCCVYTHACVSRQTEVMEAEAGLIADDMLEGATPLPLSLLLSPPNRRGGIRVNSCMCVYVCLHM